jgi:hypothetical protein
MSSLAFELKSAGTELAASLPSRQDNVLLAHQVPAQTTITAMCFDVVAAWPGGLRGSCSASRHSRHPPHTSGAATSAAAARGIVTQRELEAIDTLKLLF